MQPPLVMTMSPADKLAADLVRLTRERDAERAGRMKAERELHTIRDRLRRALAVVAVLRQREAQSRR